MINYSFFLRSSTTRDRTDGTALLTLRQNQVFYGFYKMPRNHKIHFNSVDMLHLHLYAQFICFKRTTKKKNGRVWFLLLCIVANFIHNDIFVRSEERRVS